MKDEDDKLDDAIDIEDDHREMVQVLCKPGDLIVESTTPRDAHLSHMALGVAGEAGELVDAIKKHTIYSKDLDVENVIEELGDLEFYMEGIRMALGILREDCLKANMDKLAVRYRNFQYSDQAAQTREDKK